MKNDIIKNVILFLLGFLFSFVVIVIYKNVNRPTSFCEFSEERRLSECPAVRTYYQLDTGGELIVYICDNNFGYIETRNLSKKSSESFLEHIAAYKAVGMYVAKDCTTKSGEILKLTQGKK